MPKFTPGPWAVGEWAVGNKALDVFSRSADCSIADMAPANSDEELLANARLIAAAPDMYKFIRTLYELITNPEDDEEGLSLRFIPEAAKQILDRIDGEED